VPKFKRRACMPSVLLLISVGALVPLMACGSESPQSQDRSSKSGGEWSLSAQANLEAARARLDEHARMSLSAAFSRINAMCNPSCERFAARQVLEASLVSLVSEIDDSLVLGALYWECDTRGHHERLSDSDVHWEAQMRIVKRLAKIRTKEAAATLVGLFGSEAVCVDGEIALTFGEAITTLGDPCLPHLEQFLRDAPGSAPKAFAEELRRMIQEGKIFGP
jgi:hypothetical protein